MRHRFNLSVFLPILTIDRLIVTLGWILDKPLTLLFDLYKSIALFLAGGSTPVHVVQGLMSEVHPVLTVSYVVQDGRSNWLEGMVLLCAHSLRKQVVCS